MLTPKMTGIFDCRKYDQSGKKSHDQREILADTENVTFSALFPINDVPEVFMVNGKLDEFARPRVSKRERLAAQAENREPVEDVVAVKFKIGASTRWFDEHAKPCDRPTNTELEANRWNVQIDFARKEKDTAQPLKPSGYWCNNIMVEKVENNPFAGQAFSPIDEPDPEEAADPENQTVEKTAETKKKDDLPFD